MKNSAKNSRYEIRLAGSGGQGIVLAGVMLAEAATLDGLYVGQSQNYGAETRGGNSSSEIVVSNTEIDYPRATKLDMLVALTQDALVRNLPDMKEGGLVIVDADLVHGVLWGKVASLPLARIAREAGEERAINAAALGAVAAFCPLVSRASLAAVLSKRLPPARLAANRNAFEEAFKVARGAKATLKPANVKEEAEI